MIKGRIFDTLSGGPMRSSWLKSIWDFFGLSGLVVDFESEFNDTTLVEVEKRPRHALALRLFTTTLTSLECIPLGIFLARKLNAN